MKPGNLNRRRFFKRLGLISAAGLLATSVDARLVEPHWLRVRRINLASGTPVCRFAYFTDLHFKGAHDYAQSVVNTINDLNVDFACFGGDLVEDKKFAPAALELLSGLTVPLYGVAGNHDFWSGANFEAYRQCYLGTGGAFLMNQFRDLAGGKIRLHGLACRWGDQPPLPVRAAAKNIVLMHYPAWVKKIPKQRYDLMLAGHSHGGQVRLPLIGSLVVPFNVDQYDMGMYQTDAGPLYVNPGIGCYYLNVRFNCRPEVTVFEV